MDKKEGLISIIIVSHRHGELVYDLIESIGQFESKIDLEIVLLDNLKSEIADISKIKIKPFLHIVNDVPKGLSENVNHAVSRSSGEYICIVNPDVIFTDEVFSGLICSMKKYEIDIIAPLVIDTEGNIQDSYRNLPTPLELLRRYFLGASKFDNFGKKNPELSDWLAGIFLLLRKDLFLQISGYNERYFLYFEDVEFSSRARLKGKKIAVDKNFTIIHNAQRRSRVELKYLIWHFWSAVRFFSSKTYRDMKKLKKESKI